MDLEKQEWVLKMRKMFSKPEMIEEDGSIKQSYIIIANERYFQPKSAFDTMSSSNTERQWTDVEKELLVQGLAKYGVSFGEIHQEFLPEWTPNDLRVKCQRMVGRQSLEEYKSSGWRPQSQEIIQNEFERNKKIGNLLGAWKGNVLVNDDQGRVAEYLQSHTVRQ